MSSSVLKSPICFIATVDISQYITSMITDHEHKYPTNNGYFTVLPFRHKQLHIKTETIGRPNNILNVC